MLLLSAILLAVMGGCGDAAEDGLVGGWDAVSIESEGMTTDCPGEITLPDMTTVSCGTETIAFNGDGTYASVELTDETGAPINFEQQGTWSTSGATLTLTCEREGPVGGPFQPCEEPAPENLPWEVTGNTLTIEINDPSGEFADVKGTFERQ